MNREQTVEKADKTVEKWVEKGFVPEYMLPEGCNWYDVRAIDDKSGVEYVDVCDAGTAREYYLDYLKKSS